MLCPCADQESIKNDQFRGHTQSGGQIHDYDVVQTYSQARDRLYHGVVTDVAIALKATLELVDGLYEHYRDRHYELSKMSRSGVSQHFHLHCDQDS